ncbi:hypothetical protein GPJ56_007553 [Histomonas meleagridis]|uniref:uncharacterized protein n=1 Tax=Histomonas meleagridis TaxID=135588 RepID=UPI00355978EC|nr:hypothetical protein GPJ56_007553 [Histomonas meleagridis]KAH0806072.1 hypothetical protein GO595_001085 [Histomonas meleagridis]
MTEQANQPLPNNWNAISPNGETSILENANQIYDPKYLQFVQPTPFAIPPPPKKQRKERNQQQKVLPPALNGDFPCSNDAFIAAKNDPNITFSSQKLGFLPTTYWVKDINTFDEMVTKFFQRKNNSNCRFPHKLFNALTIVENDPEMWNLIGVKWVTHNIFKVDKYIFGRLLGITSIDGGLFHRQGNFPSHGFVEIQLSALNEMKTKYDLDDVDMDRVHMLQHRTGLFCKTSSEESITNCKWAE